MGGFFGVWRREDGADDGHAGRACADDGGGVFGVDAADAEVGDADFGCHIFDDADALGGLAGVGAGGEDGSRDEVVGALALGVQRAVGVVDGAAYEHFVADEGSGVGGVQGLFAEVDAVGVGEEGYVHAFVDDEQGVASYGVSDIHCKFEELTAWEIFFTKLYNVDAALDGEGDLLGKRSILA